MTLATGTARDTIAIERAAAGLDAAGGENRVYSAANRGALPTQIACRIQPLKTEMRIALGMRGEHAAWKILAASDPSLTLADRVRFVDAAGRERIADVVEPSIDLDGQSRLFRALVEELENAQ